MVLNINKILAQKLADRLGRSATKLELLPRIKVLGKNLPELTKSEKESILSAWDNIGNGIINLEYWRFYKALNEGVVNPFIVPDNLYWSRIIRALNPVSFTRTYINKSLYPIIFREINQPDVLLNVINGIPYDGRMNHTTISEAISILNNSETDFIIKPTVATSGGHGVSKIKNGTSSTEISKIPSSYGQNFICQRAVKQSPSTAIFNESSLNTFRVNTINLNGKVTCECLMMRHGQSGSIVDNFAVGGVVCGMTKNGHFTGTNFNTNLERLSNLPNGSRYIDISIPEISEVIEYAINSHQKYMPHIGQAAWDFAIDMEGKPVMIEVNLMLPGIVMEQLTSNGSIFGDRTEEVIKYAFNRNKTIKWTEFVGGWE